MGTPSSKNAPAETSLNPGDRYASGQNSLSQGQGYSKSPYFRSASQPAEELAIQGLTMSGTIPVEVISLRCP